MNSEVYEKSRTVSLVIFEKLRKPRRLSKIRIPDLLYKNQEAFGASLLSSAAFFPLDRRRHFLLTAHSGFLLISADCTAADAKAASMTSARKLIRDAKTKEWLTHSGEFTPDVKAARELTSLAQASRICRGFADRRLEMVLYFSEPKDEVILPIDEME